MKVKGFLLILVIMLFISGCGKKKEQNLDPLDKTQDVLEKIENTKKEAAEDSAYRLRKSVELYYATLLLELSDFDTIEFTCSDSGCIGDNHSLDLYDNIPSSGKIILNSDGSMLFYEIVINGYNCDIPNEGEIICSK